METGKMNGKEMKRQETKGHDKIEWVHYMEMKKNEENDHKVPRKKEKKRENWKERKAQIKRNREKKK